MYYRGANAALLLYDITNASTFNDIRGWLQGKSRPYSNVRALHLTPLALSRTQEKLST